MAWGEPRHHYMCVDHVVAGPVRQVGVWQGHVETEQVQSHVQREISRIYYGRKRNCHVIYPRLNQATKVKFVEYGHIFMESQICYLLSLDEIVSPCKPTQSTVRQRGQARLYKPSEAGPRRGPDDEDQSRTSFARFAETSLTL